MTIYDRISTLLKLHNKTRKQLCIDTGISYNTLSSLHKRKSENMNLETVSLIAKYLDVSVDYLILGSSNDIMLNEEVGFSYNKTDCINEENELLTIYKNLNLQNKKKIINYAKSLINKS